MKKIAIAAAACLAAVSFTAPAMADSLVIKVKPAHPVVRKVVVVPRVPVRKVVIAPTCRTKVVKTVSAHKTVIKRTRVCN